MTIDVGRRAGGLVFVWIGVAVLLLGVGLLVGAAVEQQGVASYNSACSRIASCTPAPDPSATLAIAGGLFVAMGVGFLALGGYQYAYRAG